MDAIERLGDLVPGGMEILTFVDRHSFLLRRPEKTIRIFQDLDEIGRVAARRILDRLGGAVLAPTQIVVPARRRDPSPVPVTRS